MCPDLERFHFRGQVVGLRASLADTLRLHLQRMIQTDQASFIQAATALPVSCVM